MRWHRGGVEPFDPWFARRPTLSLVVSALLFAAVTALNVARGEDLSAGLSMLYVLPVALLALTAGRAAGIAGGLLATLLLGLWVLVEQVDVEVVGLVSRAVPLLLVGYLLGAAADDLGRAQALRVEQRAAALRYRQAIEVNDLLVQGMAASKWSFEAGRHDAGLQILDETIGTGQELVSRLISDAGVGAQVCGHGAGAWGDRSSPDRPSRDG